MPSQRPRRLTRVLAWMLGSGALLAGGFAALVGAVFAWNAVRAGALPSPLQRQVWRLLATTVWLEALLPLWAATLASWLVLLRVAPRVDRSWRTLLPGLAALAALWFAPIGAWSFDAWHPAGARDVVGTLALCAGGVSAALLLPRWLWRPLAPGGFTQRSSSG